MDRRTSASEGLRDLLGLSDEEMLALLQTTPLDMVAGADDEREDVRVLLALVSEAEHAVGAATLRRWLRATDAIDVLLQRDFPAFEGRLSELQERGFVLRSRRA
jgi:hypothetical protein